jgi:hypothetical protein
MSRGALLFDQFNNVLVGQNLAENSLPVVLASDQTAVPVTQAATEEATFTVIAANVALGNLKSLLSIYNPPTSALRIKLREFYIRNPVTVAVTGVAANFELKRWVNASAPTGGTAIVARAHDTDDILGAGIVCGTGVTIGGTEEAQSLDIMRMSTDEWGPGTLDQEGAQQTIANYLPARAKRDAAMRAFTARPGQGLHMKMTTNTAVSAVDIIFVFSQV